VTGFPFNALKLTHTPRPRHPHTQYCRSVAGIDGERGHSPETFHRSGVRRGLRAQWRPGMQRRRDVRRRAVVCSTKVPFALTIFRFCAKACSKRFVECGHSRKRAVEKPFRAPAHRLDRTLLPHGARPGARKSAAAAAAPARCTKPQRTQRCASRGDVPSMLQQN